VPYYQKLTYSGPGTQPSIGLDACIVPFNAVVACSLLGGASASYKLQFTLNPLSDPLATDADANWFDSPDIPGGSNTSALASFLTPAARVRLVIASLSGGSLQIEVQQPFSVN